MTEQTKPMSDEQIVEVVYRKYLVGSFKAGIREAIRLARASEREAGTEIKTLNDIIHKGGYTLLEVVWNAAKAMVTVHHYNGATRPPIDVGKYETLEHFLAGKARQPN